MQGLRSCIHERIGPIVRSVKAPRSSLGGDSGARRPWLRLACVIQKLLTSHVNADSLHTKDGPMKSVAREAEYIKRSALGGVSNMHFSRGAAFASIGAMSLA